MDGARSMHAGAAPSAHCPASRECGTVWSKRGAWPRLARMARLAPPGSCAGGGRHGLRLLSAAALVVPSGPSGKRFAALTTAAVTAYSV